MNDMLALRLLLMAEIIDENPIGRELDIVRNYFSLITKAMGFDTPFEAIGCIADGGKIH